jgi:peptidoglycan/LPS O-acetylase OafA/YrhL
MTSPDRFVSLDGLRGIAAIAVVLFHVSLGYMPGGYLAVDFFFCLSGFVIALAFGKRFADGLSFRAFATARFARLYPMMFIGGLLGIILHGGNPNILLLVPDFLGLSLFPTNPPFWSLLAEVLANIAFALVLVGLSTRKLALVALVSGLLLAFAILSGPWPRELGSHWDGAGWAVPRTLYSFTAGMLIYRWHAKAAPVRRITRLALLLPAALFALTYFGGPDRALWDTAAILFGLPAIVWLGTRMEMPFQPLWQRMGALSYPLYCIHVPLIALADDPLVRLGIAVLLVPAALALDAWYDKPVRTLLAKRFAQAKPYARPAAEV